MARHVAVGLELRIVAGGVSRVVGVAVAGVPKSSDEIVAKHTVPWQEIGNDPL